MQRKIVYRMGIGFVLLLLLAAPLGVIAQAGRLSATSPCDPNDAAWIGTQFGLNCIDKTGWHSLPQVGASYTNEIEALATCPNGHTWATDGFGLILIDDQGMQSIEDSKGTIEGLTCDSQQGVWVNLFDKVGHYDSSQWTIYDAKDLGSSERSPIVKGIAVAPDSRLWVVLSNSVSVYDGKHWQAYEQGKGLEDKYWFGGILVDKQNQVWVSHTSGILRFDGKQWTAFDNDFLKAVESMAVDAQNNLWVGDRYYGLSRFDGKNWVIYNAKNSRLAADSVRALAVDAQGRVWIGTTWGLSVFNGTTFESYQMHTSDLLDNFVSTVSVSGNGPELPKLIKRQNGSLTGTIQRGASPVSGATVIVCPFGDGLSVEVVGCTLDPHAQIVSSDKNGKFIFANLPIGRYAVEVGFSDNSAGWMILLDQQHKDLGLPFSMDIPKEIDITEGQQTDLGAIDITPPTPTPMPPTLTPLGPTNTPIPGSAGSKEAPLLNPCTQQPFTTIMTNTGLQEVHAVANDTFDGRYGIAFALSQNEEARHFTDYTASHIGQPLAIVLDGMVLSAPIVQAALTTGGEISGDFTKEQAQKLAAQLQYQALPIPLVLEAIESTPDGLRIVLAPQAGVSVQTDAIEQTQRTVAQRANTLKASKIAVQLGNDNKITINVANLEGDPQMAAAFLQQTALLEFVDFSKSDSCEAAMPTAGQYIQTARQETPLPTTAPGSK